VPIPDRGITSNGHCKGGARATGEAYRAVKGYVRGCLATLPHDTDTYGC
jgi:hypothetical protein